MGIDHYSYEDYFQPEGSNGTGSSGLNQPSGSNNQAQPSHGGITSDADLGLPSQPQWADATINRSRSHDPYHIVVSALIADGSFGYRTSQYQLHVATNRRWADPDKIKTEWLEFGHAINKRLTTRYGADYRIATLGFLEASAHSPHVHSLVHLPSCLPSTPSDLSHLITTYANRIWGRSGRDVIFRPFNAHHCRDYLSYISKEEQWAFNRRPTTNPLTSLSNLLGFA